jgi:putative transposase
VVRTPPASPNCNAHAERFVQSIKEECLDRVLPLGEWHLRRLVRAYVTHYQAERNHQGIGNALIDRPPPQLTAGPIRRRQRVGEILSYYYLSCRIGRHDRRWDSTRSKVGTSSVFRS